MNYYNEIDKFPAQWLRNLSDAGSISRGVVDERSISEVTASDLQNYTQCHFFAGIGVWSYALRLAGWSDNHAVWTGSCPCQPFSAAGKRGGTTDARHLWPEWFRLIRECRPRTIFGEQVASKDGLAWLDIVSSDLEAEGYTVGALDLCASGFGAPHIRQRLFFVAHSEYGTKRPTYRKGDNSGRTDGKQDNGNCIWDDFGDSVSSGIVAHSSNKGLQGSRSEELQGRNNEQRTECGPTNGFWSDAIWLPCKDGKSRATQPSVFPLAHGIAGRVGRLRAYGNAIVAPVAAEFIRAYMEEEHEATTRHLVANTSAI